MGSLVFSIQGISQERFSVRYDSGFPNTLFMSVIEVEDGYVCTGFIGLEDSNARPMLFVKFDYEGNQVFQTETGSDSEIFSSQNPDLAFLNDSTLIHSGISFDGDIDVGYIAKFDLEGDTLEVLRYVSPVEDVEFDWFRTTQVKQSCDGHLFMLSTIVQPETGGDFMIRKIDQSGEILWEHIESTNQANDVCRVMIPTDDGGVIAVNKIGLLGEAPDEHHFFKLGANDGSLEWEEYIDASTSSVLWDATVTDYGFACLTARPYSPPPSNGYAIPTIICYDMDLEQIWQTDIWSDHYHYNHGRSRVLTTQDGQVVACGWFYDELTEPTEESGSYNDMAWIAKLDAESGEIIWVHYYQHLDLPYEKHRVVDMRQTSDGGFILCGQSTDLWPSEGLTEPPYQQGWLLKLDEFGCLSENCVQAIEDASSTENKLLAIGPNPASEYLSIFLGAGISTTAYVEIVTMQGKLIYRGFQGLRPNASITLSTTDWVKGMYLVSLVDKGKVLQSERLILE